MSVSTKITKDRDKGLSLGEKIQNGQETNMSASGKMVINMDKVSIHIPMEGKNVAII